MRRFPALGVRRAIWHRACNAAAGRDGGGLAAALWDGDRDRQRLERQTKAACARAPVFRVRAARVLGGLRACLRPRSQRTCRTDDVCGCRSTKCRKARRGHRATRGRRWLESKRGGCDFDRDAVSEREACCVHRCRVVQVLCLRVSKSVQSTSAQRVVKSSASERARHGFKAGAESRGEHPDPMKKHRRLQSF